MEPPIPVAIIKNLRCGHCRKFVTCGPVYVTPDSSILCGRCRRFAKNSYRNIAFESVASMFRYPCYYWPKHCNKKLVWNEALDHERKCLFQSSCNVFCSRPGTFFKSDRKLPNISEINLEHVPDDILEELKCVACECYLSNSPVHIFVDGRNICHRCSHSNGIPKGAIRNLAYETLATSIIFPCIYRFRGCPIRLKFGREMWGHENECPYGQITKKLSKKPSKVIGKDGKEKERGVIETHSGHIWGTITPHSALFAPPKTKNNDGKIVTQELTEKMKKKIEETRNFDSQSMDSVMSKASTFDSLADNISRSTADNISRDNVSRSTVDNISRDNISRSTVDNISRDNVSRSSSRVPVRDDHRPFNDVPLDQDYRPSISNYSRDQARLANHDNHKPFKIPRPLDDVGINYNPQYHEEVTPIPTPPGYNKVSHNGYYDENVAKYGRPSNFDPYQQLYHYPPVYYDNNINRASANFPPTHSPHVAPKRSESLRVGNQELIDELKLRQHKKNSVITNKDHNPYGQCSNVEEIVQRHNEVFN